MVLITKRYLRNKESIIIQCYVNFKICEISQIAKYFVMHLQMGFKLRTLMPEDGRGHPKHAACNVRFNNLLRLTAVYRLLLICNSSTARISSK
jgi:hypothetical protein